MELIHLVRVVFMIELSMPDLAFAVKLCHHPLNILYGNLYLICFKVCYPHLTNLSYKKKILMISFASDGLI